MSATRSQALRLYRELLAAGKSYPDYNIRHYIIRRTKEDFRAHQQASDAAAAIAKGREQLALIQRQSIISGMYKSEPSVMEVLPRPGAGAQTNPA